MNDSRIKITLLERRAEILARTGPLRVFTGRTFVFGGIAIGQSTKIASNKSREDMPLFCRVTSELPAAVNVIFAGAGPVTGVFSGNMVRLVRQSLNPFERYIDLILMPGEDLYISLTDAPGDIKVTQVLL